VLNYAVNGITSLKKKEDLEVETVTCCVEAGAFNVQPIVVPMKGFRRGELRGNLVVSVIVEKHPKFQVQPSQLFGGYGNKYDVISQEKVDLSDLLKGAKREYQTMYGFQKVRIRPGTGPGAQIHITGKGCNGGDHVIVVAPSFPSETDLRSSKWKGLDIDWSE
jgi:DnaJ-class molecular chaperone